MASPWVGGRPWLDDLDPDFPPGYRSLPRQRRRKRPLSRKDNEIDRLRTALEIVAESNSHKEAVLIAQVVLQPWTAAIYHGPTLRARVRWWFRWPR